MSREPVRTYLYGVLVPGLALCVAYGLISAEQAPLWIAAGGAVLGFPAVEVARSHVTPTKGNHVRD